MKVRRPKTERWANSGEKNQQGSENRAITPNPNLQRSFLLSSPLPVCPKLRVFATFRHPLAHLQVSPGPVESSLSSPSHGRAMSEPAWSLPPTQGQLASQLGANARAGGTVPTRNCPLSAPPSSLPLRAGRRGLLLGTLRGSGRLPGPSLTQRGLGSPGPASRGPRGWPPIGLRPMLLRRRRVRGRAPSRDGGRRSGVPQPATGQGFPERAGPLAHVPSPGCRLV